MSSQLFYCYCRKIRKISRFLCFAILLSMGFHLFQSGLTLPERGAGMPEGVYTVSRAVDGDTLLLTNGIRVRLLGIDTPETVKPGSVVEPFGPEATAYTRQALAEHGNRVYLRLDRERVDKFGRILAFVYLGESDAPPTRLLNEELAQAGLARALLTFNYSAPMKRRLAKAQADAKLNRRGIWSLEDRATGVGR